MAYDQQAEFQRTLDKHLEYDDVPALSLTVKFMTQRMSDLITASSGNYFHKLIPDLLERIVSCKEENFEKICSALTQKGKKHDLENIADEIVSSSKNLRKVLCLDDSNVKVLFPNLPSLNDSEKFFKVVHDVVSSHLTEVSQKIKKNMEEAEILYKRHAKIIGWLLKKKFWTLDKLQLISI